MSRTVPAEVRMLARLDGERVALVLRRMTDPAVRRLFEEWPWQAHGGQKEPEGDWRVWLLMAGRGFGKTRAGAEWVWARARANPGARIALVGGTIDDVVKVMVEGESGLLALARTGEAPLWLPTRGTLLFPSGATAFVYSAEAPGKLRGPQHHFAWCDELAKWANADEAWDNLTLGLRLGGAAGSGPRCVVTTTPRPLPLLTRIQGLAGAVTTRGRMADNVHLAAEFRDGATAAYGGTRLGRQELDGEYLEEVEGALWSRELIERSRHSGALPREFFTRVVIGVDPPGGVAGDACGIVVAGLGPSTGSGQSGIGYVLADATVRGLSPEGWAAAVARAADAWAADRVIAEGNVGGGLVESVLRAVERHLPLTIAHARDGKVKRAEPVAALFEKGRAKFAGRFPALEDELAGLTAGGAYQGPGRSPDRADACVWALTELMLARERPQPRIRML